MRVTTCRSGQTLQLSTFERSFSPFFGCLDSKIFRHTNFNKNMHYKNTQNVKYYKHTHYSIYNSHILNSKIFIFSTS